MVGISGMKSSLAVFVLFVVCAGLALWAASGEAVGAHLARLHLPEIAALLGLSLVNYALRAARWKLFASALGIAVSPVQTLRHYFGGFALTLTPARVGELVRLRWIARETGARAERLAPMLLADRAGDLAATGLLLALALALGATGIAGGLPAALVALIVALVATRPALFAAVVDLVFRLTGWRPRLFVRARRAARALAPFSAPRLVVPALALGMAGWLAEGYAFYLLLDWTGAALPLWTATAIFVFSMLTGGATGLPGGLGGAEAVMLALLSLQGVPLEISVPVTAIIRVTTLWFAIGLGMIVFPFAETLAARSRHALESK